MDDLFRFMKKYLATDFDHQVLLKKSSWGYIYKIRHTRSHQLYTLRDYTGSCIAYQKLICVSCASLPVIYEAAFDRDQNRSLVLEEYIQGDTLASVMENAPLKNADARRICLDICDGLAVFHSLGMIHRDVKPENVILSGNKAVLIDFETAREVHHEDARQKDTSILGTIGYAAPEQYGLSQTNEQSDIYAMGVLLNEMLTLEHPSVKLVKGRWGRIVQKCTMVNPKRRFATIQKLQRALL